MNWWKAYQVGKANSRPQIEEEIMNENVEKVKIRKAKDHEAPEIKELLSIVWDDTYKDIIPKKIIDEIKSSWHSLQNIRNQIIDKNTIFNIAEKNNRIVGILTAIEKDNKYYLNRLYVLPGFQRKGIGKKLLNNLISANSVKEIELEVEEENENGIGFYIKEGFIRIGTIKEKIMDFEFKNLIMNKKINS
jgi:diamine N-acetyltransferase